MSRSPAIDLLGELRERGVELQVQGDRLRFRPASALPPELLQRVARLKPELIALLAPPRAPEQKVEDLSVEEADRREPTPEPARTPEAGDGPLPVPNRCPRCGEVDFQRPREGGTWRCARCAPYEASGLDLDWWPMIECPFAPLDALAPTQHPRAVPPDGPCTTCGEATWWRLPPNGPWTCARCHPPLPPPEAVETLCIGRAAS